MATEQAPAQSAAEPAAGSQSATPEPSIKDLVSQLEMIKAAQSGSDRKVKELSDALTQAKQENDELRKERMSEKEKTQYEIEKREKAILEKEAEIKAKELAIEKANVLGELDIPHVFAQRIRGGNKAELQADAKSFRDEFNAEVAKEVNKRLANSNPAPRQGSAESSIDTSGMTKAQSAAMSPDEFRKKVLGIS